MKAGTVPKTIESVSKKGQPQGKTSTGMGFFRWYESCAGGVQKVGCARSGLFLDHL